MSTSPAEQPSTEPPRTPGDVLADHVGRRATQLWHGYDQDVPAAVATLARLRRALPDSPHTLPEDAWEIFASLPPALLGQGDEPSRAEYAAAAALSFFALHQQSRRDAPMHRAGTTHSVGRAVGRLSRATANPGVRRRFQAVTRAADARIALPHLRGLVTQLRSERIPLDYGALARDLYRLQDPRTAQAVRMRWTRDFHRAPTAPTAPTENPTSDSTETTGDPQ